MEQRAHVIVLGNEKGGTGKSTTVMHLAVGLMREDLAVATIDLDPHQGTLTRYIENRRAFAAGKNIALPVPEHHVFEPGRRGADDDRRELERLVGELAARCDALIIDSPGSDSVVARHALSLADTIVTPVNDSFIDLDLIGKVGADARVLRPSAYSQIVWEQKQRRAMRNREAIDWIVMRNRVSAVDSRNKRDVGAALGELAKRVGFRFVDGFSERVIFRQLFLRGLTVLDLRESGIDLALSLSHVAARHEIRGLLEAVARRPAFIASAGTARVSATAPANEG